MLIFLLVAITQGALAVYLWIKSEELREWLEKHKNYGNDTVKFLEYQSAYNKRTEYYAFAVVSAFLSIFMFFLAITIRF